MLGQARDLGGGFFDAAIAALASVEEMPGIGSPTIGELIGIEGLRRVGLEDFPHGWFCFDRGDHLDVMRLLADRQDIERLLER